MKVLIIISAGAVLLLAAFVTYCLAAINSSELEREASDEGYMEWLKEQKKKDSSRRPRKAKRRQQGR